MKSWPVTWTNKGSNESASMANNDTAKRDPEATSGDQGTEDNDGNVAQGDEPRSGERSAETTDSSTVSPGPTAEVAQREAKRGIEAELDRAQARIDAKKKKSGFKSVGSALPVFGPPSHIGLPGTARDSQGPTYNSNKTLKDTHRTAKDTDKSPVVQDEDSRWEVRGISEAEAMAEVERHRIPTEDIEAFVWEAVERNNERYSAHVELVGGADDKGNKEDHWTPCFTLGSILLGHPEFKDLKAYALYRLVDEILGPKGWAMLPGEDVWRNPKRPQDDLIDCWRKVEKPFYLTIPPRQAMPLVERWTLTCEKWEGDDFASYRRTVSLCFWYSLMLNNDGEFFLSYDDAGKLIGLSARWAGDRLKRAAEEDKVIKLLKRGTNVPRKSSVWEFLYKRVSFDSD